MYSSNNTPLGYGQLNPYTLSPLTKPINTAPAGGRTLQTIVIIIATGVVIGMALGLGLGIGAAGILSSEMLTPVNNTATNTTTAFNTTTTTITTTTRSTNSG